MKNTSSFIKCPLCTVCLTSGVWAKSDIATTQKGKTDKVKVVAQEKVGKTSKKC